MSRDVAEAVHLVPLGDAKERFLLACEFIHLRFDIFACFPFPVCYSKDLSVCLLAIAFNVWFLEIVIPQ